MKKTLVSVISLFVVAFPLSASTVTISPDDLVLAFYQVNGTAVDANTYLYNLGSGASWRDTTATTTLIANLNADLTSQFGANWAENENLRVLAVGGVGALDGTVNQDPARTIYYSNPMAQFAPAEAPLWTWSSGVRGNAITAIKTFMTAMNGKDNTGFLPAGAPVTTGENSNVSSFLPPISTTSFNTSVTPYTTLTIDNIGSAGAYNVEAALAVYRVLHSTTGAKLTSHKSTGNAAVGVPQYIGTFTLATNGDLRYDIPSAPPANPYATWAASNGLSGNDALVTADPDKDGILNGVEFVVGGNPTVGGEQDKLPTATVSAGTLVFTFRRTDASAPLNPSVEYDEDMAGIWTTASPSAVAVDDNFFGVGTDRVRVSVPIATNRLFARLRLSVP